MSKIKKNKIIIILIIFLFIFFVFYVNTKEKASVKNDLISLKENQTVVAILEVNDKKYESKIANSINIYDFMNQLKNEGKIYFKEKTYSGMGKFIYEINGIKNKDRSWIYYVNGEKANIGISNYKINPGDVVSWKYEDSY